MSLELVEYSDRSLAVFGDTKAYKEQLKSMGGKYNGYLCFDGVRSPGWIFSKNMLDELIKFIDNAKPDETHDVVIAGTSSPAKKIASKNEKLTSPKHKKPLKPVMDDVITITKDEFKNVKKRTARHVRVHDEYAIPVPGEEIVFFDGEDMTIRRKVISVHIIPNDAVSAYEGLIDTIKEEGSFSIVIQF